MLTSSITAIMIAAILIIASMAASSPTASAQTTIIKTVKHFGKCGAYVFCRSVWLGKKVMITLLLK